MFMHDFMNNFSEIGALQTIAPANDAWLRTCKHGPCVALCVSLNELLKSSHKSCMPQVLILFLCQSMSMSFSGTAILLIFLATAATISCSHDSAEVLLKNALAAISQAKKWTQTQESITLAKPDQDFYYNAVVALSDCNKLYDESEDRLKYLLSDDIYSVEDARTWVSGVLANHRTCLDGLGVKGFIEAHAKTHNLTDFVGQVLALYAKEKGHSKVSKSYQLKQWNEENGGLLTKWDSTTSKADLVVAKDGSGTHYTIKDALDALSRMRSNRPERVVIYVKAGMYYETVRIEGRMKNVMLVGDGMDATVITGSGNVPDGATTLSSATFGVSGDGFWARDITFENTAGPEKHQAVALSVSSDMSIFYRCGIKGYQDTLYAQSQRQFYRDCQIYGTIDFIFGDAPVVIQNCDIFVRKPKGDQANMITAQGRENPNENTGISIHGSRVRPAPDFESVKDSFRSYLGRPWKKYSRTAYIRTDLDGLIDPQGWRVWSGDFALSTLYYAEYLNSGAGASTERRVNWPGFHVLSSAQEANPFTVSGLIQGDWWLPATGVPYWLDV